MTARPRGKPMPVVPCCQDPQCVKDRDISTAAVAGLMERVEASEKVVRLLVEKLATYRAREAHWVPVEGEETVVS